MKLKLPKIIAHRGAPLAAPENTLASLRKAKELCAKWVEFDVQLTLDGQAVIFHDPWLGRTTNGHGLVSKAAYGDIARLDAGSWFSTTFANERVPTLGEYLREAAKLKVGINIELKATDPDTSKLAKAVARELKQHWSPHLPAPLISSFSSACLRTIRKEGDNYLLGAVFDMWRGNWKSLLEIHHCVSMHLNYKQLTPQRIKAIKDASYYLLVYTVNDIQLANRLFSYGVDAIFSDNPLLLKSDE